MIVEILLLMFRGIISLIVSLLPTPQSLPQNFSDSLSQFASYFTIFNDFFPVDTFFQCFSLFISFETGILLFKFFNFVLKKLRGSG